MLSNHTQDVKSHQDCGNLNSTYKAGVSNSLMSFARNRRTTSGQAELLLRAKAGNTKGLLKSILHSRRQTDRIDRDLETMATTIQQEKYLLKSFIVESLPGSAERVLARRFLLEKIDHSSDAAKTALKIFSLVVLPLFLLFMAFYIFLFGVRIGPDETTLWIIGASFATLQDIFILQPMKIWVKFVLLSSIAMRNVTWTHAIMRDRAKFILKRSSGLMKISPLSIIQHLNAACRVARKYPGLQASRFLMSLNDYDLPLTHVESKKTLLDRATDLSFVILIILLTILLFLPEAVQDSLLEVITTLGVNMFLVVGNLIYEDGLGGIYFYIALAAILLFCIAECINHFRRKRISMTLEPPPKIRLKLFSILRGADKRTKTILATSEAKYLTRRRNSIAVSQTTVVASKAVKIKRAHKLSPRGHDKYRVLPYDGATAIVDELGDLATVPTRRKGTYTAPPIVSGKAILAVDGNGNKDGDRDLDDRLTTDQKEKPDSSIYNATSEKKVPIMGPSIDSILRTRALANFNESAVKAIKVLANQTKALDEKVHMLEGREGQGDVGDGILAPLRRKRRPRRSVHLTLPSLYSPLSNLFFLLRILYFYTVPTFSKDQQYSFIHYSSTSFFSTNLLALMLHANLKM